MVANLLQNACGEESDDWNDSNNSHVSDIIFDTMFHTPERDSDQTNKGNPILLQAEPVPRRSNGLDFDFAFSVRRLRWSV